MATRQRYPKICNIGFLYVICHGILITYQRLFVFEPAISIEAGRNERYHGYRVLSLRLDDLLEPCDSEWLVVRSALSLRKSPVGNKSQAGQLNEAAISVCIAD